MHGLLLVCHSGLSWCLYKEPNRLVPTALEPDESLPGLKAYLVSMSSLIKGVGTLWGLFHNGTKAIHKGFILMV